MRKYFITLDGRVNKINGRSIRRVEFQNPDGTYPTSKWDINSETWAIVYSSETHDKRCYVGSWLVGNVPAIHNEINRRQRSIDVR